MSGAARLAAFAVVLLAAFGLAAVAGSAIGPVRDAAPGEARDDGDAAAAHEQGEGGDMPSQSHGGTTAGVDRVRGLAVSDDGLTLALGRTELEQGRPATLRFRIVDRDGRAVRDFEEEHERRMHLIVVRRDGRHFQHLHPQLGADGVWRVPLTLPAAGFYRVFADFSRGGRARTLAADLAVDGTAELEPLPPPAPVARTAAGHEVRLDAPAVSAGREAELRFTVTRGGRIAHPEPYLGARGHLVALREGDLAYLHVHPAEHGRDGGGHDDGIAFATEFPTAGRYRLYLQFRDAGRVHTAEFTQDAR